MTEKLLTDISARQVATFTLNRPDSGNACDAETLALLAVALRQANEDTSVRVIVLRGAGQHFCSGADVRAAGTEAGSSADPTFFDVCRLLDGLAKPTVAVVQGACAGGGVALVACCDVALATEDAFFAMPEVRIGLAPGPLSLYFMRALGVRSLRRYLLTGERFSGQVAQQHGLIHAVHTSVELESAVAGVVDALLLGAPGALKHAKENLAKYGSIPMSDDTFAAMDRVFREQATSAEALEGRASFREKRKPIWYPKDS